MFKRAASENSRKLSINPMKSFLDVRAKPAQSERLFRLDALVAAGGAGRRDHRLIGLPGCGRLNHRVIAGRRRMDHALVLRQFLARRLFRSIRLVLIGLIGRHVGHLLRQIHIRHTRRGTRPAGGQS